MTTDGYMWSGCLATTRTDHLDDSLVVFEVLSIKIKKTLRTNRTLTLDDAEAVGVAGVEGAEGREAPLWEAEEEERVGEALREPGLERRPRERKVARP